MTRARSSAQGFVDHLNAVLNRTVTESRLTLVAMPWRDDVFELSRHQAGASAALELVDGHLFVRQLAGFYERRTAP
ncbi:MAG TPA: hypothetical protein VNB64_05145 [Solirubrobacteraceae bacterium]|nr:hypothetical protein [Solirubrobacteraceae bacterium]